MNRDTKIIFFKISPFFHLFLFACILLSYPLLSVAQTIKMHLRDILQVENIRLEGIRGNTDEYEFKLSIPERWQVNQALFTFSYSHSTSLLKNRSQLLFSFRNNPLAQVLLDPLSPEGSISVPIPGRLLTPGYHPFSFSVSQHSVDDKCEDPTAPELWTWVELANAVIEFDVTLKPVPLRISAVSDFLFDPKNPSAPPVNLIFPDIEYIGDINPPLTEAKPVSPDPEYIKPVALGASGIALRYDYRSVNFQSSRSPESGMDNLIIGSDAFVKSILTEYDLAQAILDIKGPTLKAFNLKDDIYHSLIVITGKTADEVLVAAKAFSLISLPLPDSSSTVVKDIQIPQLDPYTLKNGLDHNKAYTLSSLGFRTHAFKGVSPIPKGFSFRLPSDTHLSPNSQAVLSLNMAYGSSMREDSVLNIQLNDKFVAAIPCKDANGGTYRNYKVELLLSSMNAGYNKLTFAPQLTPLITEQCTMIQTGNLRLTIFEDSTFTMPSIDQWIEMPHLKAFMSDGFPFGRLPDMSDTILLLPDAKKSSFIAALNLVGITSQRTGFPPIGIEFYQTLPLDNDLDKDIIVVSEINSIPETLAKQAPLNLSSSGSVSYPHLARAKGYESSQGKGFWSNILPRKGSKVSAISLVDSRLVVTRFEPLITEDKAAFMQFQSPFNHKRTVLVLTTGGEKDMIKAGSAIWKPGVQASCSGDTTLISLTPRPDKEFETLSMKLGPSYYLGGVTPLPFMEYYANTYPLWFIGCVLLVCFLFSLVLYQLIKIRRKKRQPNVQ